MYFSKASSTLHGSGPASPLTHASVSFPVGRSYTRSMRTSGGLLPNHPIMPTHVSRVGLYPSGPFGPVLPVEQVRHKEEQSYQKRKRSDAPEDPDDGACDQVHAPEVEPFLLGRGSQDMAA